MPKMTDYVALWKKYPREGVPQKIPIERFCVMNGYTSSNLSSGPKQIGMLVSLPLKFVIRPFIQNAYKIQT